jgi:hypothetical protein
MSYIGSVRDDVPHLLGRPATSFRQWIQENRENFLALLTNQQLNFTV